MHENRSPVSRPDGPSLRWWALSVLVCLLFSPTGSAQRQMEFLTRGVTAVKRSSGDHFISWRMLGTDPNSIAFNVYRNSQGTKHERINKSPIEATSIVAPASDENDSATYYVRPLIEGVDGEASQAVSVWSDGFLEIPLRGIPGYRPGDSSVADLDGDGEYEIVVQQSGQTHDNSHSGLTDRPVLDAYELDGTHLWRIDLGINIRDGQH